jgi:hypothetical protein
MESLIQLKSHINGHNADVSIYPDRVEWSRKGILGTAAKATMGVMTMGASLLATGIRRSEEGEIIPIDQISHVAKKRGMGLNTVVVLSTSAGDLEMRVSHDDADRVIQVINAIKRGDYKGQAVPTATPAPQAPAPAPVAPAPVPAAPAGPSIMDQIAQLGQLHDAGILTDEEFAAKKADLLAKL